MRRAPAFGFLVLVIALGVLTLRVTGAAAFATQVALASSCAVAALLGARRTRTAYAWLAFGSLVLYASGNVAALSYVIVRDVPYVPTGAISDVFLLAAYVPLIGAALRFGRVPGTRYRASAMLDMLIFVAGWAWVAWEFIVEPTLAMPISPVARLTLASYPGLDLLMLGSALIALLDRKRASRALMLTAAAGGLSLVSDITMSVVSAFGWSGTGWVTLGWSTAYVCIAFAAWDRHAVRPAVVAPAPSNALRIAGIGIALVVATGMANLRGGGDEVVERIIASTLILALVLVRLVVSARVEARGLAAVESSERFHRAVLAGASDDVVVLDADGVVRRDVRGRVPAGAAWLDMVHPHDHAAAQRVLRGATAGSHGASSTAEVRVLDRDGGHRWCEATLTNMCDDGDVAGVVLNLRDVGDRKDYEQRLVQQALHDALTGLPNRTLLLDRIAQSRSRVARTGRPAAVLFCDLDRFKSVNDTLGHAAGDELLTTIASRVVASVRDHDTVARLGGDEFAVLLDSVADRDEAIAVAERILDSVRAPCTVGGQVMTPRMSIGLAMTDDDLDGEDLLADADIAMYEAKTHGGGLRVYRPELHDSIATSLRLESDLAQAIARGELALEYQPMFALDGLRPTGAEALLRWHHPQQGLIPPLTFLPVAERCGLIGEIGEWVLRTACAEAARWRDELGEFTVTVNVSTTQLVDDSFVGVVRGVLADTELPASSLVLEITEAVFMADVEYVIERLAELKRLGVRIAIDDFGTGYSSLNYLRRLPIDVLKIDRSFINAVDDTPKDRSLVATLLTLGRTLELAIVAEGIEHASQLSWLNEHGCDYGQGYYFAKPMPPASMLELLAALRRVPGQRRGEVAELTS